MVQQASGKDRFQTFYRYFLLRLFHDGLGKSPSDRKLDLAMEKLLERVPFLNGGFFEVHQLEVRYPQIDIPDNAFENLFAFFDQYCWHLDDRPLRVDNEINPDVVGYIFEKYINQKQMGAYYTRLAGDWLSQFNQECRKPDFKLSNYLEKLAEHNSNGADAPRPNHWLQAIVGDV